MTLLSEEKKQEISVFFSQKLNTGKHKKVAPLVREAMEKYPEATREEAQKLLFNEISKMVGASQSPT